MKHSRFAQTAILSTFGLAIGYILSPGGGAMAQQAAAAQNTAGSGTVGPLLTLSVDQQLSLTVPTGRTNAQVRANTGLGFALTDDTARSSFALRGNTGFRLADGGSGFNASMADPRIALAYSRLGATSQFDFDSDFRINDIAFLRPLTDFIGPDGVPVLPTDFASLNGTGTRQSLTFDVSLRLRDDAPFGVTLAAGVTDLQYTDVTDPDLTNNTRAYLSATGRFDITEVMQATAGLTYATFEDADTSTWALDLATGLTIARPDGELRFSLALDDITDRPRTTLGLGRDFERPNGALSFDLGTAFTANGNPTLTGSVSVRQDFALGTATASLSHNLATDIDDTELRQTTLSLGYTRELSLLAALNLGLLYVTSEDTATGDQTKIGSLTASVDYALTADWNMNAGYRFESRDEDGVGQTQNNEVFVGLSRAFEFPL